MQTIAAPFPIAAIPTRMQATVMFGAAPASPNPAAITRSEPPYNRVIPKRPSADAAHRLPSTRPTPVEPTVTPKPIFPASSDPTASLISATLTAALASPAVLHTTSTVVNGRERSTRPIPSRTSRQCPRVSGSEDLRLFAGMQEISAAEITKLTEFTEYASAGPEMKSSPPATTGPIIQAAFSVVARSDVASSRSSFSTRFGIPAQTAGRKNPVATPPTAARTTIAAGYSTNGSAANVAARVRSETIISLRRERRSTSGPSVNPMMTIGRKSAISKPATHLPNWSDC